MNFDFNMVKGVVFPVDPGGNIPQEAIVIASASPNLNLPKKVHSRVLEKSFHLIIKPQI